MLKQLQYSERSFVHFCSSQLLLVCTMFRNIIFAWYWRMLAHVASMLFHSRCFFATMLFEIQYCFFAKMLFHSQLCFFATMLFHFQYSQLDEVRGLVTILCPPLCSFSSHEPRCPTKNIVMNHIRKMHSNWRSSHLSLVFIQERKFVYWSVCWKTFYCLLECSARFLFLGGREV